LFSAQNTSGWLEFANRVLVSPTRLTRARSRSLSFTGPGGGVEVAWTGFEQLGLWSRAGGDFLCIEPWHGYASPADFDGEFTAKPGLMLIPSGDARTLQWSVRPI